MPGDWDDDDDDFDDGVGALDFIAPAESGDEGSGLDALDEYTFDDRADEHGSELGIDDTPEIPTHGDPDEFDDFDDELAAADGDAESPVQPLFSVTHPSQLLSVAAGVSGGIHHVELSPEVGRLTENELAQTIKTTANLACIKGRSVQFALIYELMCRQGVDRETATRYLQDDIGLPTPRHAAEAEAEANAQYLRSTQG